MNEFYSKIGCAALGSRLRRLGEYFADEAKLTYALYEVDDDFDPRWFPVFYMLSVKDSASITDLAEDIGQSHPAVSQVVKDMLKRGVVQTAKCVEDGRVNRVSLSLKGRKMADRLRLQCQDVQQVMSDIFTEARVDLWAALEAIEYELSQSSMYERLKRVRQAREGENITIVPFEARYQQAFKRLNEHWIQEHWTLEESDYKTLDNPEENVIEKGGYIAIVLEGEQLIGGCALVPMENGSYELAKMAVDEQAKGRGIGFKLGQHIIAKAKALGARRIFLESNAKLVPAINLYRKLGFKQIIGPESPYCRCDVQMELLLDV